MKAIAALRKRSLEIVLTADHPAVVDQAEGALLAAGGVYVRGRALVRVVRDRGAPGWLHRPAGAPVIEPIAKEHLRERLGRAANWVHVTDMGKRATSVPGFVPEMLMARGEWSFPELEGIADAPVFRIDGTIQDTPGYDARTRIIYEPCGTRFPVVPDAPTHTEAKRALAQLLEPFSDFPCVAQSDRSAIAALILSMIGRSAIDGCVPMFASCAPTPGSGKGLLVDVVAVIVTGRAAPKMAPTSDDDETRKRLLALAVESPAMVVIDNVEGAIGSPSLAMALTAGEIRDRILGSTKIVTASLRPVWAMTGNNVQLRGDLGRRVVPIDIDPRVEHPEDRQGFRHADLLAHVLERRPRLVVAALTVLRGYFAAGKPDHGKPRKGSFEAWDRLVRGAVLWCGADDPLAGVERIRDQADEDLERLRTLLHEWRSVFGERGVTVAEAITRAGEDSPLRDALAAYSLDSRKLGYALRKVRGRIVGGLAFERDGEARDGARRWGVRAMQTMQTMVSSSQEIDPNSYELNASPASPASPAVRLAGLHDPGDEVEC